MEIDEQRQLTDAAREGDHDAWERLYRNLYPRLHSYAVSRAGAVVAEDLVNESMARAIAGIRKFTWDGGGFDAWVFGILRRVCLEHYRKTRSASRVTFVDEWIDFAEPGEGVDRRIEEEIVRRAFAGLDVSDREILVLRLIAGLSAEDVAKLVGKNAGAVRTAQSRALASLRAVVTKQQ